MFDLNAFYVYLQNTYRISDCWVFLTPWNTSGFLQNF